MSTLVTRGAAERSRLPPEPAGPRGEPVRALCRRDARGAVVWTLALCYCACGSDPDGAPDRLPAGAPVAVGAEPALVVGERPNDPDHQFFRVATPFLLPDGGVGVPLRGNGTVRIFDASGELARSLGSEGEGPGELSALGSAWVRGDAVVTHDVALGRMTRFAPGEPPRTVLLEGARGAELASPGLSDGSWILHGVREVRSDGRDIIAVHRFAPDGVHLGEVSETLGFRRHAFPGGRGPDPISPRAVVRTDGVRVLVAETLTPRITEIDVATGEVHTIEWTPRGSIASEEAVRVVRETLSEGTRSDRDAAWTEASMDALTGSERVSVFWDFLVDGERFLWIRDYDPRVHAVPFGGLQGAGGGGEWTVLDREGRVISTVAVPEDFEPRSIRGDRLTGVRRDAFDVESVRVYPILRSGS